MKKEYIPMNLRDLVPYENNPRRNDNAVPYVEESIKQVGYITPIVVDENNIILCGHTRLKALLRSGEKTADVLKVTGLTEEQKKKYRLLDNKTGEFAEWDFTKLTQELSGLDFGDFNFDFEMPKWSNYENAGAAPYQPQAQTPEPQFTPNGVTESYPQDNDPYLPEKYDEEEIQQYTNNQENYVIKRRIIITYLPEQEKQLISLLGMNIDKFDKVVYDITEITGE